MERKMIKLFGTLIKECKVLKIRKLQNTKNLIRTKESQRANWNQETNYS